MSKSKDKPHSIEYRIKPDNLYCFGKFRDWRTFRRYRSINDAKTALKTLQRKSSVLDSRLGVTL